MIDYEELLIAEAVNSAITLLYEAKIKMATALETLQKTVQYIERTGTDDIVDYPKGQIAALTARLSEIRASGEKPTSEELDDLAAVLAELRTGTSGVP